MKLEFLWFDSYKKLNNFQANFGSEYVYKLDYEAKVISIESDSNYIRSYFSTEKDRELSISAIVGENGVGKSTILDFISEFIKNNLKNTTYLFVFLEGNMRIVVHNLTKALEGIKLLISEEINNFQYEFKQYSEVLEKTPNTLFFSNVFDVRYLRRHYEELGDISLYTDISTNYLLWESNDNIVGFLNKEFEKQIYFIYDYISELEVMGIIKKPDYLKLTLIEENPDTDFEKVSLLEDSSLNFDMKVTDTYFGFILEKVDEYKELAYIEILKNYLYMTNELIQKRLKGAKNYIPPITEIYDESSFTLLKRAKKIFDIQDSFDKKDIFSYLPLFVKAYLLEFTEVKGNEVEKLTEDLKELSQIIREFSETLSKINFVYLEEELQTTRPSVNNIYISTSENIKSFINSHKQVFKVNPIFNFSWTQLSSGEHGLLNLFGRIYSAVKDIEIDNDNLNSYLLLIDEGDLYFHPQWQKDWLYYFIQFINKLFEVDVQIILTTHSPLVLSDFPNSNVLFIGGDSANSYNLEGSPRTLGANILELFSNSFFIKQGLVGRYGKNQINKLTRELITSSPKRVLKNKARYQVFIDNIGEPLVRNHLTDILKGKLSLVNNNDIVNRINALEKELDILKQMRSE